MTAAPAVLARAGLAALLVSSCGDLERQDFSPPIQEGTVEVDGAELYTRSIGAGEPLLIVHGGPGMDHGYLLPGMEGLAQGYRLVFYDQRALGRSTGRVDSASISIDRYLEDLEAVRASLEVERVYLVGHSWGGLLALLYALRYPEHVGALILMSSIEPGLRYRERMLENRRGRVTPEDAAVLDSLRATETLRNGDPAAISLMFRTSFRSTFGDPAAADRLVIEFGDRTAHNGGTVASLLMRPLGTYDFWDELAAVSVPTLILHGEADPMPAEMAEELNERIGGSHLVILPGVGHFPYIEAPGETFAAIDEFLRGLSETRTPGPP